MLANLQTFSDDWDDPTQIEQQWRSLREFVQ